MLTNVKKCNLIVKCFKCLNSNSFHVPKFGNTNFCNTLTLFIKRAFICFRFDIWHWLHLMWSFKLNTQPLGKYAYFIWFNNDINMNTMLDKYIARRHCVGRMLSKFLSTHHHRARWNNPLNSGLIAACCMFSKLICSISFHFSVSHFPSVSLSLFSLSLSSLCSLTQTSNYRVCDGYYNSDLPG